MYCAHQFYGMVVKEVIYQHELTNAAWFQVIQKVTVEVDETGGSVFDASTNLLTSPLPPRLTFNRPFIFIVYHEATKSILYIGRVVDPTKS